MSKKSLKKNYIYNLAYQVLILILPLITAPYISRVLGAENIGIFVGNEPFGNIGIQLVVVLQFFIFQFFKIDRNYLFGRNTCFDKIVTILLQQCGFSAASDARYNFYDLFFTPKIYFFKVFFTLYHYTAPCKNFVLLLLYIIQKTLSIKMPISEFCK